MPPISESDRISDDGDDATALDYITNTDDLGRATFEREERMWCSPQYDRDHANVSLLRLRPRPRDFSFAFADCGQRAREWIAMRTNLTY